MPKDKNANAVALIGTPEKLIGKLVKDAAGKKWSFQKITLEGPPHKQLQHTLVLKRLEKLASLIAKSKGMVIQPLGGTAVLTEHETDLPVQIPAQSLKGIKNADKLLEKMSKGPEHEILYTALLLQVIESLIAAGMKN